MDALRPLSLDQFAAMTAEMEAGFPRDRVLRDASISVEQWELTQETWLLRMAKQGSQRKLALLDRYNELLAKHRKAAQRKMRAEKRKLKGPMPVAPEAHLSPLSRARQEDAGAGATFQKHAPNEPAERGAISTPAPVMAQPAVVAPTQVIAPPPVSVPPPVTAPHPFVAVSQAPESSPPPPPVAPAGPAWLSASRSPLETTLPGGGELPATPTGVGPAWLSARPLARDDHSGPHSAAPAAAADAAPMAGPSWLKSSTSFPAVAFQKAAAPASPVAPADDDDDEGAGADVTLIAPAESPYSSEMPFVGAAQAAPVRRGLTLAEGSRAGAAGPAWLAAAAQAQAQAQRPPPQETAAPGNAAASALPFQRPAAQAPPQAAPQAAPPVAPPPQAAPPATPPPQAPPQASPAVAPTPQAAPRAAPQVAPPPQAAPKPTATPASPRLSVEQLAWLQAQMEASAERGRAAREQLGLSEGDYAAERAFWQVRFSQDRATVERYSQLFYRYRAQR